MQTQAVIFPEPNRYEVISLTIPDPGPGDILVRTLVSAISPGTERWIMRGKHIGSTFPCVPGYQRIGVVEERGVNVKDFEKGDIIYGAGSRWEEKEINSMWSAHMGHSVSDPGGYRFLSSTKLSQFELDTVAFTIVVGVANRGIRFLEVDAYEKLLIIGAGIIGICAAQLAGLRGSMGVLLEKDPQRIDLVKRLGLQAISVDARDLEARLKELAPDGFDILYDTVGHAPTTDAMVQRMKNGSRLLLQAQYFDKEKCAIDLDQIRIREMTVKTTCGIDAQDFLETYNNIRTNRLRINPLITHRFQAPDELLRGYELLDKGKPFNLGIVFRWSE